MPHTCRSLFPSPGYKTPLPLKMNLYLQAPLRNLAFQLTPVFTLSTSSVSIQMCSGISMLKQTHSRKVRNTGSFLLREHSLVISSKFDWIFILVFNVTGIKPRAYTCRRSVSYIPTLTGALNLRHVPFTSVSVQRLICLLDISISPLPPHKDLSVVFGAAVSHYFHPERSLGSPHYNKIQKLCFSLYTQACSVHFLLDVSHLLRPA